MLDARCWFHPPTPAEFRISDFGFRICRSPARILRREPTVGVALLRMLTGRAVSDDFGSTGLSARRCFWPKHRQRGHSRATLLRRIGIFQQDNPHWSEEQRARLRRNAGRSRKLVRNAGSGRPAIPIERREENAARGPESARSHTGEGCGPARMQPAGVPKARGVGGQRLRRELALGGDVGRERVDVGPARGRRAGTGFPEVRLTPDRVNSLPETRRGARVGRR